ncbi:MAG TPA: tetratricopeptide repeat protein [Candidatus Polarisedimenticolia bacterium]|nr:tetratricopeptide repeat protein [Candidatus Polarisedimenticolia bacterium]
MESRPLRLIGLLILAAATLAGRPPSLKGEMRFGVEAAQQGLWREAIFRWEKILKVHPDNAHLHNNLAVAYESLGQFDRARQEYEEARRLDPDNREIRDNYESFLQLSRSLPETGAAGSPTPTPAGGP